MNTSLINRLPLAFEGEISSLVEHRRAFTLDNAELSIFETYERSKEVTLQFNDFVVINMIQGKKIMHLEHMEEFAYLPGQMLVLPEFSKMKIDFPEATLLMPTQCTAFSIRKEKMQEVLNYLNEFYPKHQLVSDWHLDENHFHMYNTPELAELINKLFQITISNNPLKSALADLTIKEFLIRLFQTQSILALDIVLDKNRTVMQYLKNYIQSHISERISIEMLEKKANMSKSSLYRLFNTELGISPIEFLLRERIQQAKIILRKTKNVKETCFSVGFNDVNYFVRLFKKKVGMTPGAYMLSL